LLYTLRYSVVPKTEAGLLNIWRKVGDPIFDMRSDHITPVHHYTKNYMVIIDQEFWRNKDPMLPRDALIRFTDGSRAGSGTGSGIHGIRPETSFSFFLGKFATIFQSEIYAIL
jgi:hypothetical protein